MIRGYNSLKRTSLPLSCRALSLRLLTNSSSTTSDATVPAWLQRFNDNISVNPMVTIPLYLFIRNATWYALVAGLSHFSIGGPEFAIAYLTSKVTSKFRQPVNLSVAALFAKMFPMLSHVKASALLFVPMPSTESNAGGGKAETVITKITTWMMVPFDKYGFSFYVASKLSVFVTIGGMAVLIRHGVDVSEWLASMGVSSTLQDVGGAAGLASMVNVGLIPVQMAVLGRLTPVVNKLVDARRSGGSSADTAPPVDR